MLTFREFLTEGALNFDTQDITLEGKKAARQQLAKLGGFTKRLPDMAPFFSPATESNIKTKYNSFVSAFPKEAKSIDSFKTSGVGTCELILYFVFDNIGIGGSGSSIDIYLNKKPFAEAKAGTKLGSNALAGFKVTSDSSTAVSRILKDLEAFNSTYEEITGEPLKGWKSVGECNSKPLEGWREINLKELATSSGGSSKKTIDLVLQRDGDLLRKGDSDPLMNVKKDKTVSPIKKLIDANSTVDVDKEIETIDAIEKRWVDSAFESYIDGKKFALFDRDSLQMRFFGKLTKDMLGLYRITLNQPRAVVNLEPTKSKDKVPSKSAAKEAKE